MLRWLIAILIVANLIALAAMAGVFGPTPTSGARDARPLSRQVHPEQLAVRPIPASESVDVPVVGGPLAAPAVQASSLAQ